ncbi:MAG TPA: ABC transporter permease [Planctomycetota bacterium]|nr:ABC transporter permease [Planctomycetota bacterium]
MDVARELSHVAVVDADGWVTAERPGAWVLLRRFLAFPLLLARHRDLITSTVRRELETRFRGTLLGWVWPLVYPAFMFLVYYFIFAQLLDLKIPNLLEHQKPAMGIFMFVGVLVWSGFGEAVLRSCSSIVDNGNLIKKLSFPTELLPLNVTLVSHVTMLFGVVAYVVATYVSGLFLEHPIWPPPGARLLWLAPIFVLQVLFAYGLGLLLATLQVFLRDTVQLATLLMTVWMFVSPVFWVSNATVMPSIEPYLDSLRPNPLYHLLFAWRWVLMSGEPASAFEGGDTFGNSLATFALWAVGTAVVGYLFFLRSQRRFADEV